jgi:site-specific recombinase XerD
MLLGIGTAHSDADIVAEYVSIYRQHCTARQHAVTASNLRAPRRMLRDTGKSIADWTEADIEAALRRFTPGSKALRPYATFVSFLLLRGYFRPSLPFLVRAPVTVSRTFAGVLAPLRALILAAVSAAGMRLGKDHVGGYEMNMLLALTVYSGVPLELVTRPQFDAFRATYLQLRLTMLGVSKAHGVTTALAHVEACLVQWGYLAPAPRGPAAHERRAAEIGSPALQRALGCYLAVCAARLRPKGVTYARDAVARFFIWAHDYLRREHGRTLHDLEDVTREVAVAYTTSLRARYSATTVRDLHSWVRRFFEFAHEEHLPTAPERNPFSRGDLPRVREEIPRYFPDADLQRILAYCAAQDATFIDRVLVVTLLHTGIRASECAALRASDIVQVQGTWKLHVHLGKGLKDRLIPLTTECEQTLHAWCQAKAISGDAPLFQHNGRQWCNGGSGGGVVAYHCRNLARTVGIAHANPHRFRHTFAVALLNYGIRETALQKLLGHTTLDMTLEYAKILDHTVEQAFTDAVTQMREGPLSWVPSFFTQEDYTLFAEGDTVSWIRLPIGFCRRNPKLHCESDVKCFLCERFYLTPAHLLRLREMHERFLQLGLTLKATIIGAWIARLEQAERGDDGDVPEPMPNGNPPVAPDGVSGFVPLSSISIAMATARRQPAGVASTG